MSTASASPLQLSGGAVEGAFSRCAAGSHPDEALVRAVLLAQGRQFAAEEALERQNMALAQAAHELRNPLVPLLAVARLLGQPGPHDLRRLSALVERQVRHLSHLVDDLLDVSRVATGKLRVDRLRLDAAPLLRQVAEAHLPTLLARQQAFTLELPAGELALHGDPVRLTQVFTNLLENAVKYTPRGGKISLCAAAYRQSLAVTVADDGIGITPQALPRIFEWAVQDLHAVGFSRDGLGIGLTLVRELVQAHGGTVSAYSAGVGRGSEFVVILPLL